MVKTSLLALVVTLTPATLLGRSNLSGDWQAARWCPPMIFSVRY